MATSVSSAFEQFRSVLQISSIQESTVSTRQQEVRAAVERDFTVLDSFLTGSYKRHTLISPLTEADIDVFTVLDASYYSAGGYTQLLDSVRETLRKKYPKTPRISRNGQAVTITFTDFKVDVVPAFYRNGDGYLIPDSVAHRWIETNPKTHVTAISLANLLSGQLLVPTIKMIKQWNRTNNKAFRSFFLELLAHHLLNGANQNFSSSINNFFASGLAYAGTPLVDIVPYGTPINPFGSISSAQEAQNLFASASAHSQQAINFLQGGHQEYAINEYRIIFGDRFPAYG